MDLDFEGAAKAHGIDLEEIHNGRVLQELQELAPHIQWVLQSSGCIAAVIDDMEIVDPYLSECGRFEVDSRDCYGMSPQVAQILAVHNKN